jgi:Uma2 family endonuclease
MAEPAKPLATLENGQSWPAQGAWTYEDYLRLPDDGRRYEVIRGILYVAPAPAVNHQLVVSNLFLDLGAFVKSNGLGVVFGSPLDVILPAGIATPVEPDILFLREENRPRWEDKSFQGVPDLVVEVLSPGTRSYDRKVQFPAYRDAGVPELWFVDLRSLDVVIYGLSEDGKRYTVLERGGVGDEVGSRVLPGFRVKVGELFR